MNVEELLRICERVIQDGQTHFLFILLLPRSILVLYEYTFNYSGEWTEERFEKIEPVKIHSTNDKEQLVETLKLSIQNQKIFWEVL